MIRAATALAVALGLATVSVAAEPTPAELQKAIDSLNRATKALDDARKTVTDVSALQGRIITAESEINILKQDIEAIKRKLDIAPSTSLKPGGSTSFVGMGRVRFINEHPLAMSVVVNGLSYRLAPGEERLIPVSPGDYTYQVLQIHNAARVRRISANETKTFTIYAEQ